MIRLTDRKKKHESWNTASFDPFAANVTCFSAAGRNLETIFPIARCRMDFVRFDLASSRAAGRLLRECMIYFETIPPRGGISLT